MHIRSLLGLAMFLGHEDVQNHHNNRQVRKEDEPFALRILGIDLRILTRVHVPKVVEGQHGDDEGEEVQECTNDLHECRGGHLDETSFCHF